MAAVIAFQFRDDDGYTLDSYSVNPMGTYDRLCLTFVLQQN
jgi:hypothetical protein